MGQSAPAVQSVPREVHYDRGTNWRAQLGFIVISTDLVMKENIVRLAPEGVGTSVTRLKSAPVQGHQDAGADGTDNPRAGGMTTP